MTTEQHAATCRWALPTLFLAAPWWLESENRPWTCLRDLTPRVLASTDVCAACPRWEPRAAVASGNADSLETSAVATAAPAMVDWFGGLRQPHETD